MKRLLLIVMALALLVTSAACYPLRIAKNPNEGAQGTEHTAYDPDEFPDETDEPGETEAQATEPDDSEAPTQAAETEAAQTGSAPTPAASATAAANTPAANTPAPSQSAATTATAAPSQSSGTTAAPSQSSAAVTPGPTPTPRPTPTPTPQPTATPAPTPAPTPTPAQNTGDFSEFSSSTINGYGTFSNDTFSRSKLTMVNFWATWCGPCIEELPNLQQLSGTYSGRMQIMTVLYDSSESGAIDTAMGIINNLGINLPVARCNKSVRNAFSAHAGLSALPVTFFVDQNGHLVRVVSGAKSYSEWCSIINGML